MPAPPCTQNRSYLQPLFPSLWGSAPKQTHSLKCPLERRFAPARSQRSAPLNTQKVAASSDRPSPPPAPGHSPSCSPNSRAQGLPPQLWLQSFRSSQIASCSFLFPSCRRMSPQLRKARLAQTRRNLRSKPKPRYLQRLRAALIYRSYEFLDDL